MAKKVELKERGTGEILYPVTLSEHVITSDNRDLQTVLNSISSGGGNTEIADGSITENKLSTDAVSTIKVKNQAITKAKLSNDVQTILNNANDIAIFEATESTKNLYTTVNNSTAKYKFIKFTDSGSAILFPILGTTYNSSTETAEGYTSIATSDILSGNNQFVSLRFTDTYVHLISDSYVGALILQSGTVTTDLLQDNAITESKLDQAVITKLNRTESEQPGYYICNAFASEVLDENTDVTDTGDINELNTVQRAYAEGRLVVFTTANYTLVPNTFTELNVNSYQFTAIVDDKVNSQLLFFTVKISNTITAIACTRSMNYSSGTAVIDNLTSSSTSAALSANQGKVLNDKITAIDAEPKVQCLYGTIDFTTRTTSFTVESLTEAFFESKIAMATVQASSFGISDCNLMSSIASKDNDFVLTFIVGSIWFSVVFPEDGSDPVYSAGELSIR